MASGRTSGRKNFSPKYEGFCTEKHLCYGVQGNRRSGTSPSPSKASKQGVPQQLQRRLNKQVGNVAEVKIAVKSLKNGKTEHFKWLDSQGIEWLTMLMNKIMEEETIYAIDERPNTQRSSLLVYEKKRNTGEISKNS